MSRVPLCVYTSKKTTLKTNFVVYVTGQGLWKRQNNPASTESVRVFHIIEDVPLVEFMYLVLIRMPGESYCRRLKSLLLCSCVVFRALINSLVC